MYPVTGTPVSHIVIDGCKIEMISPELADASEPVPEATD